MIADHKPVMFDDGYWVDAEEIAENFPETFERPFPEEIDAIQQGDFVKIGYTWDYGDLMEAEGSDELGPLAGSIALEVERFWVAVEVIKSQMIIGQIAHPLRSINDKRILGAKEGDRVALLKHQIYDIMTQEELDHLREFHNKPKNFN